MISPATCTCGGTPVADIRPDESPAKFEITAPPDATPPGSVIKCTSAVTIRLDVVLTCPDCGATATIPSGDTITALTKIYRDDAANTIARRVRAAVDLANNVWGRREGDPPLRNVTIGAPQIRDTITIHNADGSKTTIQAASAEVIASLWEARKRTREMDEKRRLIAEQRAELAAADPYVREAVAHTRCDQPHACPETEVDKTNERSI